MIGIHYILSQVFIYKMSLNLNTNFRKKLNSVTADLIDSLTSFKKESNNYKLCEEFALSQFFHHRFMSIDNTFVMQEVSGLIEKFELHSEYEKSDMLKKYHEKFMSLNLTHTSFSGSNVHYCMIYLLLGLSQNPLETAYTSSSNKSKALIENDEINWVKYLKDGLDLPPKWESSSEEEFTDEENEKTAIQVKACSPSREQTEKFIKDVILIDSCKKSNLLKNLVPCYWKNSYRTYDNSEFHRIKDIASLEPYIPDIEKVTTTEYYVIRESIWLLNGLKPLHVFQIENDKYCFNKNVFLTHLTSEGLKEELQSVIDCANNRKLVDDFLESTLSSSCLTYQAFASSLRNFLNSFSKYLQKKESKVLQMKESYLLRQFLSEVSGFTKLLNYVSEICKVTVLKLDFKEKNILEEKVKYLLNSLYNALVDDQLTNLDGDEYSAENILLNLWIQTLKPYIDFIDNWIMTGELVDKFNEFSLKTVKEQEISFFWQNSVTVNLSVLDSSFQWLLNSFSQILAAGKSMKILKMLYEKSYDHKQEISTHLKSLHNSSRVSIFDKWLKNLLGNKSIKIKTENEQENSLSVLKVTECEKSKFKILLNFSFSNLVQEPLLNQNQVVYECDQSSIVLLKYLHHQLSHFIIAKSLQSSVHLLQIFQERFGLNKAFDQFQNFNFMGWGDVMHHFSSEVFNQFTSSSYSKNTFRVEDFLSLNIIMQDSLEGKYFQGNINVVVVCEPEDKITKEEIKSNPLSFVNKKVIIGTDCIELEHNIRWPLTLVFSKKSQEQYNQIFHYLMKIKHSIYSLESLKVSQIYKEALQHPTDQLEGDSMSIRNKLHKFSLLRAKMLHLLKNWQSFVMTSVVESEKQKFQEQRKSAKTIDEIIKQHDVFLQKIFTLCLLNNNTKGDKLVQGSLLKIMTLSVAFSRSWQRGCHVVDDVTLRRHEKEFNECSDFLKGILKTVAKRRSMPIFETLAYSVLS